MKGRAAALLIVLLLVVLAMWPGLNGPFLHDDYPNLSLLAVGPPTLDTAWQAATSNASGPLRRPVANLSLAANYWAHGAQDPFGFKLVNLVLHLLCALAVWLLASTALKLFSPAADRPAAAGVGLFAAVLWASSPIQVSTVLYVVQRMTQLAALFSLLALWLVLRWLERADFSARSTAMHAFGFAAFTALAVGSKENAAVVPALAGMLTLFWWGSHRPDQKAPTPAFRAFFWGLMLAPTLVLLSLAASLPDQVLGAYAVRDFTVVERMATQPVVLWFYLQLFLAPILPTMGLFHDSYPVYGPTDWPSVAAACAWIGLILIVLALRRRAPILAVGTLWFLIAHGIESSVIGLEMVYEHRNYLPLVGVAMIVAWLGYRLSESLPSLGRVGIIAVPAILVTLTFLRSVDWSSEDRFYSSEYRRHPDSLRAMVGETYRLQSLPDTDEQRAALIGRIIERHPRLIWPFMAPIPAQCVDPGVDVPWRTIHQRLRSADPDPRIRESFKFVLDKIVAQQCPHLDRIRFRETLELAHLRAQAWDAPVDAEVIARFLGWMHRMWSDKAAAERWMHLSAGAHPDAFEALFDLFYFHLNDGEVEAARAVLEELMRREPHLDVWIRHRIQDASRSLGEAEKEHTAEPVPQ